MAKARRSGERTAVLAFNGRHTRRPQTRTRYQSFRLTVPDDPAQTNILIDRDFRPRLTDYGLTAIISDPSVVHSGSAASPPAGTVQYMAPELLNPSGSGLGVCVSMKESDIYAFGMVTYEVRKPFVISDVVTKGSTQITARQQPFPGVKDRTVIHNVIAGVRPSRPQDSNEWVLDNVWDLISRCWSSSLDSRPDAEFTTNTLTDAADAAEARRRSLDTVQERRASHQISGTSDCHRL